MHGQAETNMLPTFFKVGGIIKREAIYCKPVYFRKLFIFLNNCETEKFTKINHHKNVHIENCKFCSSGKFQ